MIFNFTMSVSRFWQEVFPYNKILNKYGGATLDGLNFSFGAFYRRKDTNGHPLFFRTQNDLKKYLTDNGFQCFDIGFNDGSNRPLFFDVDIDKLCSEKRCKCGEKECCDECWVSTLRQPLMNCLNFLKCIMGYEDVMPIFSGNKGFWIIVWDKSVWKYDEEGRKNICIRMPTTLDMDVTLQESHLCKVPYSPHKKTGKLCVIIDDPETFLPSDAPHYSKVDKEWMEKKFQYYRP